MCARIKYTALVESISGSIQGTTFQRNAYGYTVKAKPNMVNPNRLKQTQRKASFSNQVRLWRTLSETDRAAWQAYAENFPTPTRLNPDSNLNGFNLFVKWHSTFNQGGNFAFLEDPGTTQDTLTYSPGDLIRSGGALIFEGGVTNTATDWLIYVYATPVIPFGQEWIKVTPRFMSSGTISANSYSVNFADAYASQFGSLPVIGEWIGVKIVFIRESNAQIAEFPAIQMEVIA
jgi:hypothetical protein